MGALERNPGGGDNWVEKAGGLPAYIEKIAKRLHETRGMDVSRSIATAVTMVKKWAAGGDGVNPDTRAKAAAALAEWNAKRAKAKLDMSTPDDDVIDLAYGDHKPPYDWKHGYKPISPQAMRIKAKKEKSPNGGKRRRVAGEAPAKGRTPAQAKAADDAQRGRGVPGADTGDAPKSKPTTGSAPARKPIAITGADNDFPTDTDRRRVLRASRDADRPQPQRASLSQVAAEMDGNELTNAELRARLAKIDAGPPPVTRNDGPDPAGRGSAAQDVRDESAAKGRALAAKARESKPGDTTPPRKSSLREDLGGDVSRLDPPKVREAAAKRKAALEGKTGDQLKRAAGQHRAAGRTEQAAEVDAELAKRRAAGQVPSNTPEYREQRAERMATTADPRSPETQASDRERMVRAMSDAELTKELNKRTIKPENKRAVQMELRRRNDAASEQARENGRKRIAAQQSAREAQAKNDAARAARPPESRDAAMRRQSAEQDAAQRAGRSAGSSESGQTTTRAAEQAADAAENKRLARVLAEQRAGNNAPPLTEPPAKPAALTPTTVSRMSDDQLEKTLDRLAEAGDFSSPAFKAVEAEQAKREDRRAEGNRPRR